MRATIELSNQELSDILSNALRERLGFLPCHVFDWHVESDQRTHKITAIRLTVTAYPEPPPELAERFEQAALARNAAKGERR